MTMTLRELRALDLAQAFGVELRALRAATGWPQKLAAERIGIARPNYARAEKGMHTPQIETMVRAAVVFGVEPHELLRRTFERARAAAGGGAAAP